MKFLIVYHLVQSSFHLRIDDNFFLLLKMSYHENSAELLIASFFQIDGNPYLSK